MIGEISTVIGLRVYTDEGKYIGKVEDLVIDMRTRQITGIAMTDFNKTLIETHAPGIIIPYRLVKSVGDIVIVKDVFKKRKKPELEEEEVEV